MHRPIRTIFIASSTEDRGTAMMIVKALLRCNQPDFPFILQPMHWENSEWTLNQSTLSALVQFPKKYDYGCFLFTPNDTVISRNITSLRGRDNVVFEFGLFVSQEEGLKKAFIMHPVDTNLRLAADLAGIITAKYHHSDVPEALAVNITDAAETVFKAVSKYEKEKIERSEKAVKHSLENLREKLQKANESQQPEIILAALRDLAETKAQALNQTATEVLKDILIWTNTILDIIDADELAKLQSGDLEMVWVYSSLPIELDSKLAQLNKKFKETVFANLEKGVKYVYFIDAEKTIELIREISDKHPNKIEVYLLDPYCVTSNYVVHFYKDKTNSVYQNVVRKGVLESLIKLEKQDADLLINKISSQFDRFYSHENLNLTVKKKKSLAHDSQG